jgi:hypothetical protein
MDVVPLRPDHRDSALAEAAARADIAKDRLVLRTLGFDHRAFGQGRSVLKDQFGIEVHHLWGCVGIPEDLAAACKAYNRVMEVEIRRRFGDAVERAVAAIHAVTTEHDRGLIGTLARAWEGSLFPAKAASRNRGKKPRKR